MANHRSALKRARQTEKRNARNRALRSVLRTAIKNYRSLLASKELEAAHDGLAKVHRTIDRAVTKGVLHKNAAARYKSRLTAALAKGQAAA